MNRWISIIACIILSSCADKIDDRVFGDWTVKNRYYQATYQITNEQGKTMGKVLNYDDGTTTYSWDENQPKYIFQNLKSKDGLLIDGISGATIKSDNRNIEFLILHEDTLNATFFINNHPTSEFWVRKK